MARRTHLKAWDKRLLMRIRQGYWTTDELQWVLDHLDEQTPTLVIQEIHGWRSRWDESRDRQAAERDYRGPE